MEEYLFFQKSENWGGRKAKRWIDKVSEKQKSVIINAAEHSSADATEFCFSKLNKVEFDAAEHSSADATVFVLNGQIQQGRI